MTTKESDRVKDYNILVFDFMDGCRISFLSKGAMFLVGSGEEILVRCTHGIETIYIPNGMPDMYMPTANS